MNMPGLTAEASLRKPNRHYLGQGMIVVKEPVVVPQTETCDIGYIGDGRGLYIVCCDPDRWPPCIAYGMV
jgi:hypothetical protein